MSIVLIRIRTVVHTEASTFFRSLDFQIDLVKINLSILWGGVKNWRKYLQVNTPDRIRVLESSIEERLIESVKNKKDSNSLTSKNWQKQSIVDYLHGHPPKHFYKSSKTRNNLEKIQNIQNKPAAISRIKSHYLI